MLKSNCIAILNLFVFYFDINLGMSSLSNKWEPFFYNIAMCMCVYVCVHKCVCVCVCVYVCMHVVLPSISMESM